MDDRQNHDKEAHLAYMRAYYADNSESIKTKKKEYRKRNKLKANAYAKKRYSLKKEQIRDYQLRKDYGISLEQYNLMLDNQNGKCSLCESLPGPKRLAVDHDHVTGKVRSLLCNHCNVGIGHLKDNPELIEKAAIYIKQHRG